MAPQSTITTQEAKELLDNGWRLMQFKNAFYGHVYYVRNENVDRLPYGGYCKYINRDIFDNLVNAGYVPCDYMYVKEETND